MKSIHLYFLVSILLFSSCHSLVEDELPAMKSTPVINSILKVDSVFKVHVSLTANLGDSVPKPVANALVVIRSSTDTPDTLLYTQKGWYVSSRVVKANTYYSCLADIPGCPQVSAQTYVPQASEITRVVFTDVAGKGEDSEKISSFEFIIQNDTTQHLFWEVRFMQHGPVFKINEITGGWRFVDGNAYQYIYFKPEQDSVMISEASPLDVFSNEKMRTSEYKVRFYFSENSVRYSATGKFFIELRSVDESYYKYQKQLYLYQSAQYTGLGSTAQNYPLYNNVKNGYGIFTSYSVYYKSLNY